ncbi:ABC transporter G family member 6 [Tripterygium wilfordii]|uniref:ABC transporter G family member 6 n=1 Tax=Tripterygium wilfordii TaxID=458696 RepID=A0A7J7C601_TRIWF|nr:ABC transporter G family member 6 [Tripterygium wilfordii]
MSTFKYPCEGILQKEFDEPVPVVRCFVRGVEMFDNTPLGAVPGSMKVKLLETLSKTLGMRITSSTCWTTGQDILAQQGGYSVEQVELLDNDYGLGVICLGSCVYLSLLIGSKNKRR